jgi:hypothetical protein
MPQLDKLLQVSMGHALETTYLTEKYDVYTTDSL